MGKGRYGLDLSPSPSGLKATRNNAHQQGDNKDLSTQSSHLLLYLCPSQAMLPPPCLPPAIPFLLT